MLRLILVTVFDRNAFCRVLLFHANCGTNKAEKFSQL